LLELVAEEGGGVLHGHLHDHVPVHHLGDELEAVVPEVVVVAEEEGIGHPAEGSVCLKEFLEPRGVIGRSEGGSADLVPLEVDDEGEEGRAGHHDVDDKDPGVLPALEGLEDSVAGMGGDVASGVRNIEQVDAQQFEHRLR
jgi:hypothetical protein